MCRPGRVVSLEWKTLTLVGKIHTHKVHKIFNTSIEYVFVLQVSVFVGTWCVFEDLWFPKYMGTERLYWCFGKLGVVRWSSIVYSAILVITEVFLRYTCVNFSRSLSHTVRQFILYDPPTGLIQITDFGSTEAASWTYGYKICSIFVCQHQHSKETGVLII